MNPEKPNQPTPEEITEKRDQYEKDALHAAKKHNSFFENITGKGLDKNLVMQSDALAEDELLSDSFSGLSRSGLVGERYNKREQQVELLRKAAGLFIDNVDTTHAVLKGTINGKALKIEFRDGGDSSALTALWNSTLDGKELKRTDAQSILEKYYPLVERRTYRLRELKKEVNIDKKSENEKLASKKDLDEIL